MIIVDRDLIDYEECWCAAVTMLKGSDMLEYEVYELLEKYGIKIPYYEIFDNYEPLVFDRFPAVLKIASPKIVHKSDVGGVRVGIHSYEELELAREEMIAHL